MTRACADTRSRAGSFAARSVACRRHRAVLLLALFLLAGCAARKDPHYTVRPGDTLHAIGARYGTSWEEIARANGIRDPGRIRPGQVLRIPDGRGPTVAAAAPHAPQAATSPADPLLWPVAAGRLSSPFGPRKDSFHDGVDISAPFGTPVLAAERGVVVYSGHRRGYGNVVVVRHAPGLSTLYAHNQTNWVRVGQAVRRGEVIASVGDTGRTTGANLHFEVWLGDHVVDPMRYLRPRDPLVADAAPPGP